MDTEFFAISNPEKEQHESWAEPPDRNMMDFPRPFRWAVFGHPNCGKTTTILNYLMKAQPYDRIFLLHPRSYNPEVDEADRALNKNLILPECEVPEYAGVEYFPLAYVPNEKFWVGLENKNHSLFIIDDIDLISMSKGSKSSQRVLNKLFSYVSTHHNVSIIVSSQSPSSQLPSIVFQMCDIGTLYKMNDKYKLRVLAQKMGQNQYYLEKLLGLCKDKHENITFDSTADTPYPIRKNFFTKINVKTSEDDE